LERLGLHLLNQFPVVCLCGSAGGLEAYKAILSTLTASTGMAFVILSHRGINRPEMLRNLLSRHTEMPVSEAEEGMHLEPNCILLMPPSVQMTVIGPVLHLRPLGKRRGDPTSISTFLLSLAASVGPRAVAVILSGMGKDGSESLAAIKAGGGTTFAQSGAIYDSMPQHAIATGRVDFILSAAEIGTYLSADEGPWLTKGLTVSLLTILKDRLVQLVLTNLDLSLMFMDVAEVTCVQERACRNHRHARIVYDTAVRLLPNLKPSAAQQAVFDEKLGVLKTRLQAVGQQSLS
jgi:CheB methylesterase